MKLRSMVFNWFCSKTQIFPCITQYNPFYVVRQSHIFFYLAFCLLFQDEGISYNLLMRVYVSFLPSNG